MRKAIPVMAALAIAAAAPALAQQEYRTPDNSATTTSPDSTTVAPPARSDWERDQQAQTPESQEHPGTVETLRQRGMSAPNVSGDRVPESPETGLPEPQARGNPKSLEGVPRP